MTFKYYKIDLLYCTVHGETNILYIKFILIQHILWFNSIKYNTHSQIETM